MSFLRRVWHRITNPTSLVGRDLEGNRYYEYPNPISDRPKRVVKYRRGYDMWTYVAGGKRLPVQWNAWLSHTRPHPPTLEELYTDLERQKRILQGAALIEARERGGRSFLAGPDEPKAWSSAQLRPLAQSHHPQPTHGNVTLAQDEIPNHNTGHPVPDRPKSHPGKPDPFAQVPPGSDETQSWNPRIALRRG